MMMLNTMLFGLATLAIIGSNNAINIAVIQSSREAVISEGKLLNMTSIWNYGNDPDININSFVYSNYMVVKKLAYNEPHNDNPTEAFISTDECSREIYEIFHLNQYPLIRVNSDPLCDLNKRSDSLIITYPMVTPFESVMHHLLSGQNWNSIQVIYSEKYEVFLTRLSASLHHKGILVKLFKLEVNSISSIAELVKVSHNSQSGDVSNIVLCEVEDTVELLRQTGERDDWKYDTETDVMFNTRWLVLCFERSCPETITNADLGTEFLAVLDIDLDMNYPFELKYQDVLHAIAQASLMSGLYSDVKQTQRNKHSQALMIKSILEDSSFSSSCFPYTLYTTWWDVDKPVLSRQYLCKTDGKTLDVSPLFPAEVYGFSGRYFRIYTMESKPFVYKSGSGNSVRFYGMCIELLKELATRLNFTYDLKRSPDGQFGAKDKYGNWTGLVGLIERDEADIVVASLTASSARDTVMDFVHYHYEYGGLILKKPDEDEDKWQVILKPFKMTVWLCLLVSVPLAGAVAAFLSRVYYSAYPGNSDEFVHPSLSTWYTFGAILTQGGSYLPRSTSSRYFLCSWWAFSIVVVATYGGSLIAYLTIDKDVIPITTLEDLIKQDRYKWGTKMGSFYFSTFKAAKGGIYSKLYDGMMKAAEDDSDMISKNTQMHFDKVSEGNYAYITDKTPLVVKAISDKTCRLALISENFLPMPFGIGIKEGSPFKRRFDRTVTGLRQTGLLQHWKQKWWPKQECSGIPLPESKAISLIDTQSAFYLLLVGIFVATVTLTVEWCRLRASVSWANERGIKDLQDIYMSSGTTIKQRKRVWFKDFKPTAPSNRFDLTLSQR